MWGGVLPLFQGSRSSTFHLLHWQSDCNAWPILPWKVGSRFKSTPASSRTGKIWMGTFWLWGPRAILFLTSLVILCIAFLGSLFQGYPLFICITGKVIAVHGLSQGFILEFGWSPFHSLSSWGLEPPHILLPCSLLSDLGLLCVVALSYHCCWG